MDHGLGLAALYLKEKKKKRKKKVCFKLRPNWNCFKCALF